MSKTGSRAFYRLTWSKRKKTDGFVPGMSFERSKSEKTEVRVTAPLVGIHVTLFRCNFAKIQFCLIK